MAFCENCGKKLAEGESCSCKAAAQPVAPVQSMTSGQPPQKEKKNIAVWILILLIILILALVGVVVYMLLDKEPDEKGSGEKSKKASYMDPLDDFLKEFNDKNADYREVFATLMPDDAAKLYLDTNRYFEKSDVYMDEYESDNEYAGEVYDELDDLYGEWELSFEKSETTKITEEQLTLINKEIADSYEEELEELANEIIDVLDYGLEDMAETFEMETEDAEKLMEKWLEYLSYYKEIEVTAVYEVTGRFVLEAEDGNYESSEMIFWIGKKDGNWFFMSNAGRDAYFEGDDRNVLSILNDYLGSGRIYVEIEF